MMNERNAMSEDFERFQCPKTVESFAGLPKLIQTIVIAAGFEYIADFDQRENDIVLSDGTVDMDTIFEYIEAQINAMTCPDTEDDDEDLSLINMCARAWMWMNLNVLLMYFMDRDREIAKVAEEL